MPLSLYAVERREGLLGTSKKWVLPPPFPPPTSNSCLGLPFSLAKVCRQWAWGEGGKGSSSLSSSLLKTTISLPSCPFCCSFWGGRIHSSFAAQLLGTKAKANTRDRKRETVSRKKRGSWKENLASPSSSSSSPSAHPILESFSPFLFPSVGFCSIAAQTRSPPRSVFGGQNQKGSVKSRTS